MMASRSIVAGTDPALLADRPGDSALPFGGLARFGLLLTAGLTSGVIAFVLLDVMGQHGLYFSLPEEVRPLMAKRRLTPEESAVVGKALRLREYQNTALAVAVFGAVVGGLLGLAAGTARRSLPAASAGLVGGMAGGAFAGAVGGIVDLFALERLWPLEFDHTYKAMAGHSAAFLIAGVGIGVAAGLAAKRVPQTLGVVLGAALIAGLIYPGIAAAIFPVLNTDAAVPEGYHSLLLWTVLPAGLMGLAIGRTKAFAAPLVGGRN